MRSLIGLVAALLMVVPMNGYAQVFDAVPPPADFRFIAADGNHAIPTTFQLRACAGCRDRAGFLDEAVELVGIVTYVPERNNYTRYSIQPSLNINKQFWMLPTFSVDRDGEFTSAFLMTFITGPWQFNSTFANPLEDIRVGQVSVGYKFGKYATLVPGRQIVHGTNWFVNYRFYLSKMIWLQGRYTFDVDRLTVSIFTHWNGLFSH